MAQVSNLKGLAITNRDATPAALSNPQYTGGDVKQAYDYVTTLAADSIGSIYRLCQVPSNARVSSVELQCAAMGTSCTMDVGVYYPTLVPHDFTKNATAISQAFFASAVDVSGALGPTNVTNESGTNTISKQRQMLWEALGLSADPNCVLDICATVTAATVNAALLSLKVSYIF